MISGGKRIQDQSFFILEMRVELKIFTITVVAQWGQLVRLMV